MLAMQLQCAMIYVKDLPRMRDFYTKLFGAGPVNREWTDVYAQFETGGARFALHAIPAEIAAQIEISTPPKPRERSPVKLAFHVGDAIAEKQRLESMGVTTILRPWQNLSESCDAVDPEGNIFQISSAGEV
jgi:catechol 2,3-dioxygenase-like lactoylglutathione lyase family enzyme